MKKILTMLVAVALTICCVFTMGACGKKDGEAEKSNNGIIDVTTKTITVGYTDYAPMNYTENGIFKGFDTELALRVFNALGYDVMFKEIDWDQKFMELENGTIDCIWNGFTANVTEKNSDGAEVQRNTLYDFTYAYMINKQCIFTKSANNVTNISALNQKSVAYEGGSAGATAVEDEEGYFAGVNTMNKPQTAQMDAAAAVLNDTADYAVIDIILAQTLIEKNNDYAGFVVCDIDLGEEKYAIGFKKGNELKNKVNVMLEAFGRVGYLEELALKYGLENSLNIFWLS